MFIIECCMCTMHKSDEITSHFNDRHVISNQKYPYEFEFYRHLERVEII